MKRMPMEKFEHYQERRRRADLAIARKLRPRMVHESTRIVTIPAAGEDEVFDEAVLRGEYRDLKPSMAPRPVIRIDVEGMPVHTYFAKVRVGRTKGVTCRKPKEEAQS